MAASLFYFQGHQHGLKAIILGLSQEGGEYSMASCDECDGNKKATLRSPLSCLPDGRA